MIDKKPFRVTDSQLEDIMNGENHGIECDEWNDTNLHAVVSDLQDARDLIDKQEALIKEMLEEISIVVSTASSETTKSELSYISNYTEMRDLLKKTKDYA